MTLTLLNFTVNPRRSIINGCKDPFFKCVSLEIVELCLNILPESVASSSLDWDYPPSLQLMAEGIFCNEIKTIASRDCWNKNFPLDFAIRKKVCGYFSRSSLPIVSCIYT